MQGLIQDSPPVESPMPTSDKMLPLQDYNRGALLSLRAKPEPSFFTNSGFLALTVGLLNGKRTPGLR